VNELKEAITLVDIIALIVFFSCWVGYRYFAELGKRGREGLVGITHEYRLQWAMESTAREIPVACGSLTGNLMNSVSFYASTTIYIIAGLFALFGTIDQLEVLTVDMHLTDRVSRELIQLKLLLLIFIFITAYFKFTWSLRQFNFLCILIGGTVYEKNMPNKEHWLKISKRMARINSQAGNEFNRGIRSYYYGIASLSWFIHPWLFIAATIWVTGLLYHRDFHSKALKILRDEYPPEYRDNYFFMKKEGDIKDHLK